jgi:hypothetical protein
MIVPVKRPLQNTTQLMPKSVYTLADEFVKQISWFGTPLTCMLKKA